MIDCSRDPLSSTLPSRAMPVQAYPRTATGVRLRTRGEAPLFDDMVSLLRWRADRHPERPAYAFLDNGEEEDDRLTFADLDLRARTIAATLQEWGAIPGDRVLLLLSQSLDYIAAFFGCLYAGVVAVPVYPPVRKSHVERIRAVAADCGARFVLTQTVIEAAFGPQMREFFSGPFITVDQATISPAGSWQPRTPAPDALAFLQYTSGSTGQPKGVMVSHDRIMANEAMIADAFDSGPESTWVSWLPFFHDMGLLGGILQPMYLGSVAYLMTPMAFIQKPVRWLQAISRCRAAVSGAPNFAYDMCLKQATEEEKAALDLQPWKVAFNGAEPVRAETVQRFTAEFAACGLRSTAMHPCYGMAETTLIATGGGANQRPRLRSVDARLLEEGIAVTVPDDEVAATTLTGCGKALLEADLIIVSPDAHEILPANRVGEVWVAGPHVAYGYWRNEAATARDFCAFLANGAGPYLRTGDLGLLDEQGEVFITARLKDVIILRGRNYIPSDIEQAIEKSHPAINPNGVAVVGFGGEEEMLAAVVEMRKESEAEPDYTSISRAVRAAVSTQFDVKLGHISYLRRSRLPRTTSGKLQRQACRRQLLAGEFTVLATWSADAENSATAVPATPVKAVA
jgi:acyl-CoA synthetase (AMP-forming)/AMP-acid ligase II